MQNFFKKIIISLALTCTLTNSATAMVPDSVFDAAYQASNGLHHFIAHSQSIQSISYWLTIKRSLPTWDDAPEAVIKFCRARFAAHGLDADKIAIKIVPAADQIKLNFTGMAAYSNNALLIASAWAEQLNQALLNTSTTNSPEETARVIKLYSTIIDHEIAHLKNGDGNKIILVTLASSIATDLALTYFAAKYGLHAYVEKPASWKKLAWVAYLLAATGTLKRGIAAHISNYFTRCKEHNADEYAYATSQDPEALRIYAKWFASMHEAILDYLEGKTKTPPAAQQIFSLMKMTLEQEYVSTQATEPFRDWIIHHRAALLERLAFIIDPSHPSANSRSKAALAAAKRLEAQTPKDHQLH